jgi:hypothetical protein
LANWGIFKKEIKMDIEQLKLIISLFQSATNGAVYAFITYLSFELFKYILGFGVLGSAILVIYKLVKPAVESVTFKKKVESAIDCYFFAEESHRLINFQKYLKDHKGEINKVVRG